jgi:hypothetical protein
MANTDTALLLSRDNGDEALGITSGLLTGSTPEEVIANACPGGSLDLQPIASTTLLGSPTVGAEGTITADCSIPYGGLGNLGLAAGFPYRIVAADVDGHVIAVFATYLEPTADAFVAEFDALVASMEKLG